MPSGAVPAADAGGLHAAHRGRRAAERQSVTLVDVDGACAQPRGDRLALGLAARPHTGVEPVFAVVRLLDGFLHAVDGIDRHHRAERLVACTVHLVGDVGQHCRFEEGRADVGPLVASCNHLRAFAFRVLDMPDDGFHLVLGDQAAHVGGEVVGGRQRHPANVCGECGGELLGHLPFDIDAFDGDAQLACVGKAGSQSRLRRSGQVGVLGHDHRVLAAQFGRESDQATPALLGQCRAGGTGSGEHQVVAVVDDRRAHHRAGAGHDGEQLRRQSGLVQQLGVGQCAERREAVRLDHDGVSSEQRRDGVGDGQRHRVVPRRDDADDTLRVVVHHRLDDAGQQGLHPLWGQQVRGFLRVVARVGDHVEDILLGGGPGLAGLGLGDVHQVVAAIGDELAEPVDDHATFLHRAFGPPHLCGPRPLEGGDDIVGGADRDGGQVVAGEHLGDRLRLAGTGVVDRDELA